MAGAGEGKGLENFVLQLPGGTEKGGTLSRVGSGESMLAEVTLVAL
jgi:hypothetical protein